MITAAHPHGLFNGTSTLRQLFPAMIESATPVIADWTAPAVEISDAPRFIHRGVQLDPARSFVEVDEVKAIIDTIAAFKQSRFHFHLADDQGWRIEITNEGKEPGDPVDYTKLTEISGQSAMLSHANAYRSELGRTRYYTQDEYKEIVAYAAERFVTVIPEIDVPGHTKAMLHAIPELNSAEPLTATIDFGDGTAPVAATFTTDSPRTVGAAAGLYRIGAEHTFAAAGTREVTVTLSDGRVLTSEVTARASHIPYEGPVFDECKAPTMELAANSTRDDARLGVTLTGLQPNSYVDVIWDGTKYGTVRTDAEGDAFVSHYTPYQTVAGPHLLRVQDSLGRFVENVVSVDSLVEPPSGRLLTGIAATTSSEASYEPGANGIAAALVDGDRATYWHSHWQGTPTDYPHWMAFDLGAVHELDSIVLVPHQDSANGRIKQLTVQVSEDGENWTPAGIDVTVPTSGSEAYSIDVDLTTRHVRLHSTPSQTPTPTPSASASPTPTATVTVTPQPSTHFPATDVYSTPGLHEVGGRRWFTQCEPYSQTFRCFTQIWSTQVTYSAGRFSGNTGWHFNNLTYLASPRSLWTGNPLGNAGTWQATDGRQWRTECDTAATGRNGCRSYVWARNVVTSSQAADGTWSHRLTDQWVFNNIVRFR